MSDEVKNEILRVLPYFTGSEQMWEHRTPFGKLILTDGCNYVREKAQSRWLFDLLHSYQRGHMRKEDFQVWDLERVNDMEFLITCTDGNENMLARQKISFSDFPLNSITIWLIDEVCLLPSEY